MTLTLSLFASGASATTERELKPSRPTPSRARVLSAVDSLLKDPIADKVRPEFSLIVHFAKESDAVDVTLGPPYFEFDTSNKPLSQMLLGYFMAGAVKFDLEHPPLAHDQKADAGAAIRAALVYYREHRRIHPRDTHPLFDKLDALERQGGLDAWIASQGVPAAPGEP